jgi:hypothetical protein
VKRALILATLFLVSNTPVVHAASIGNVKVISSGSSNTPVEIAVDNLPVSVNNFDPNNANLNAEITFSSGKTISVPLFWYQEYQNFQNFNTYNSRKVDDPEWRLRFRALEAGQTKVKISGKIANDAIEPLYQNLDLNYGVKEPIRTEGFGFYEGARPFIPIAYNMAWADRYQELNRYEKWFKSASASGVNVARVWMAAWSLGIEWINTGLGDYTERMQNAWTLDQVFKLGAKYGINIQLVLLNHGAFSESTNPEWFGNPYNKLNGGPLDSPSEFATNPIAIKYWQQRLRYIAARYAAYPNLFAWEWWNEVNFTPISQDDLSKWMTTSRAYLEKFDPYKNLITTSWSTAGNVRDWSSVDFASVHVYDANDPIKVLANVAESMHTYLPNKPTVLGEMGSGTLREDPFDDPFGLHLHNAQWAATFRGFNSPASYWWWDTYIEPLNLWGHTKGLSKLIAGLDLVKMNQLEIPSIKSSRTFLLQNDKTVIGWTRLDNYTLSAKNDYILKATIEALRTKKPVNKEFPTPVSKGGSISIPVITDGKYKVSVMKTLSGQVLSSSEVNSAKQKISIKVPAFTGDISFKVEKVGA